MVTTYFSMKKNYINKHIFLITYLSVSFVSANHMQASVAQWIKELSSGPKEQVQSWHQVIDKNDLMFY